MCKCYSIDIIVVMHIVFRSEFSSTSSTSFNPLRCLYGIMTIEDKNFKFCIFRNSPVIPTESLVWRLGQRWNVTQPLFEWPHSCDQPSTTHPRDRDRLQETLCSVYCQQCEDKVRMVSLQFIQVFRVWIVSVYQQTQLLWRIPQVIDRQAWVNYLWIWCDLFAI